MKLLRFPILILIYFSLATVIAEVGAVAVVWAKGNLNQDTGYQLLAIAHDVDLRALWEQMQARVQPIKEAQISYEEVREARTLVGLNLDLKEMAMEKGLNDMRQLHAALSGERQQYKELKDSFDLQLQQLRQGAADRALQDVQHQLESVHPKMAKDQLLRILDDPTIEPETSLQVVVTILKAMPLDKRKRILAVFKDADDLERLHEILTQIRRGVPDVDLIRQYRSQLERFNTRP